MSNRNVDERDTTVGWEAAIRLAEAELEQAHKRGRQLRRAIRLLKKNQRDGVKWPKIADFTPE